MEISAYLDRRIADLSDTLAKAGAERLIRAYASGIPLADLAEADPELVYGAALGLFAFMRERQPGVPSIRVFDPDLDRHGWVSSHSVVEIVNDDMPFLVDSVAMELARRGIKVHLLVHPVVRVDRDGAGMLRQVTANGAGALQESVMHVEIDRQPVEVQAQLAATLADILGQVRLAVADWRRMLDTLWAGVAEFEAVAAKLPADEKQETLAFLDWLADNHFTFLGYRRFDLSKGVVADSASGLGILSDAGAHVFDETVTLADMPVELRAFVQRPDPLMVTKSARHAVIHRPVRMDIIGLKQFDAKGRVVGLHAFLGLFTSAAYNDRPAQIPLLRRKIARVEARADFNKSGHDAKALVNILETYPRDELFQVSEDALFETSIGILHLQDRQRVAVFLRNDEFERFVSCLVFVPRDRYDTPLRLAITAMLEEAVGGTLDAFYTQVADLPLARLHFIIRTTPGHLLRVDAPALEMRIADAARTWYEHLQDALVQTHGEAAGLALARRWGRAFPASYRESHGVLAAVADVGRIQAASGGDIVLNLYRPVEAEPYQGRLKLYRSGHPVPLSGILPMLEAMGLVVIAEVPHEIVPASGGGTVWVHDFEVESADGSPLDVAERRDLFHDALAAVWRGDADSDGFNRLVLSAGLSWREIMVLRAYTKYLRQTGITYSQAYIEQALSGNADMAAALVRLFLAIFDPKGESGDGGHIEASLLAGLDKVVSADDDRILRRFLNLIRSTLRTNYFQTDGGGRPKAYLSFKLDSKAVDELPAPRPLVEVFVYSPRVEAIHLRGGKVARGGIRWSDRREDFRTEILGLMKAQMVKNAVIVPVGAKGGFVVKRPPETGGRRGVSGRGHRVL
ncbi:NAD-glutamate dehydrogenase domain-containing protein [Magnetospirillum sp. 15-1]|uniref:NAD-glutamate dehydrogenase domain-containing protein n=1 Tax=Magnetospirillum sp. 15-1 TaxID=1979370 RepID=UPI003221FE92